MEQIVGDQLKHQIFQFAGNQEISWTPPPQGAIRIDVDGSVWNDQHAACGGLIRNSDGDWVVGFQKNIGTCSVTEAELVAIRTGLEVGKLYNHPMVVLYSDSMDALNLIARECVADHPLRTIITDIRELIFAREEIELHHASRDTIRCADYLAKEGHEQAFGVKLIADVPERYADLILQDKPCGFS
ncbi:uncharacterized protein LOC114728430 [Neltuma alba]|uniref:uncharacterized protein LOC114728430 n=1 Tax=Neltuma alba TaxID=207710 RepID=UPI0010A4686B|nr:uncharacterized protein LOC114728430 [Prosopis alba]